MISGCRWRGVFAAAYAYLWLMAVLFPPLIHAQEKLDLEHLSPAERQKLLERFDENHDGKLEGAEQEAAFRSIQRRERWRKKFSQRALERGPRFQKRKIAEKFDADRNGWLNRAERDRARAWIHENPEPRRGPGGPGGPGGRPVPFGRRFRNGGAAPEASGPLASEKPIRPDEVAVYPDRDLYDPAIIRTVFLDFADPDWDQELNSFHRTDVDVPARITVDGAVFSGVGVRYRGNTSYDMVPEGKKKSFNLSVDLVHGKQRVYGYRTLNLLNANEDPSFLREMLYSRICRDYIPAPKASYVQLVINGENWGIYVNLQQINTDFLKEWYGTKKGARWKIPPDFSGAGALRYLGDDVAAYRLRYDLKSRKTPEGWPNLINLCRILDRTPAEELEARLPAVLDVDQVLWFLALDNVFMDSDGYFSRGSDYYLYMDKTDRFHLIPHDNNETFRFGGGGPGPRGPGGPFGGPFRGPPDGPFGGPPDDLPGGPPEGARHGRPPGSGPGAETGWSPVFLENSVDRPLIRRLLSVPAWRARYLAHVRTIVEEWLDWKILGPVCRQIHDRLSQKLLADRKKLCSNEDFQNSLEQDVSEGFHRVPALKRFVEERRKQLLTHPTLKGPWPTIASISHREEPGEGGTTSIRVRAGVSRDVPVQKALLYYRTRRLGPFVSVVMHDDGAHGDGAAQDGVFGATTPCFPRGTRVRYYVEVRAPAAVGTTTFRPARAEAGALEYLTGQK